MAALNAVQIRTANACLILGINTVVWEKIGVKNFHQKPGATKIKHTEFSYYKLIEQLIIIWVESLSHKMDCGYGSYWGL